MVPWPTRRHLLQLATAFAAGVVVVLLVLIGLGVLVLPASTPAKVTIAEIEWTFFQGTNPNGQGWFGNNTIIENESNGYQPFQVDSGGSFITRLTLLGSANHTIYNVTAQSPFHTLYTVPATPCNVTGVDDFLLTTAVGVPSVSSDTTSTVYITINAYPPHPAS